MQEFLIIAMAICATALIVVYKCLLTGLFVVIAMIAVIISYFNSLNNPEKVNGLNNGKIK